MLPVVSQIRPVSRRLHEEFLDEEVRRQVEAFQQKAESSARTLMDSHEELFVALYLGQDKAGHAVLGFKVGAALPRLREFSLALLPPDRLARHRDWPATLTYAELAAGCRARAEVTCVWHGGTVSETQEFGSLQIAGFKGITLEMSATLVHRCVVVLGPQPPPLEYLRNLLNTVRRTPSHTPAGLLLDLPTTNPQAAAPEPQPLSGAHLASFLLGQSQLAPVVLVQGPPGTGKTFLLAELCNLLLAKGQRVLVTSLTNRALLELATKPHLEVWRERGKVLKMSLATDEQASAPGLKAAARLAAPSGTLVLATFHMMSVGAGGLTTAPEANPNVLFDYILVDEASQALLATLAMVRSLGTRHLWVGDVAQLPPIVQQPLDRIQVPGVIRGLGTVDAYGSWPSFRLTHTHRLPPRAARFTGLFYGNALVSATTPPPLLPLGGSASLEKVLHPEGGPVLVPVTMPTAQDAPRNLLETVQELVKDWLTIQGPLNLAVLTHRRSTNRVLQRALAGARIPTGSSLIVDTIARVQGLTCDVCIFVLPTMGLSYSLDPATFNVATSRARWHTILVADPIALLPRHVSTGPVAAFLQQLANDLASRARQLT